MRIYAVYHVTTCNDLYNCDIKFKMSLFSLFCLFDCLCFYIYRSFLRFNLLFRLFIRARALTSARPCWVSFVVFSIFIILPPEKLAFWGPKHNSKTCSRPPCMFRLLEGPPRTCALMQARHRKWVLGPNRKSDGFELKVQFSPWFLSFSSLEL